MKVRTLVSIVLTIGLLASSALARPRVVKQRANRAFAGRIMLSQKHYPTSAKSLAAFNAKVRKQSRTTFFEGKEKGKKEWKLYFAGFLRRPLNDVEYNVKIYELVGRQQQLLASFDQFTDMRGQYSLIGSMKLERKIVGVNKPLLLVIQDHHNRTLASTRFKLIGEREHYTGKVDFSEDDTK